MGEIEDQDKANAHAVGELGRLDPSYERAERVRVQARSVARGAERIEAVFQMVRNRPQHPPPGPACTPRVRLFADCAHVCVCVSLCMEADIANVWGVCCVYVSASQSFSRAARPPTVTQRR